MKDVRIVSVSWNVEKLLARCLASLPAACEGLSWECIVVDNASSDDSVSAARGAGAQDHAPIQVIANANNLGFGKACNMGAYGSDARYVLFLNPDTECPPLSVTQLVRHADTCPKSGIFGPKITNPDGTTQRSIRRFPTLASQIGIMLKLHHIFPKLSMFQRYFATDLDPEKEQIVDQVMGACFLVRKELIEQKLGFDERYFLWFEEVDFCKTAIQKGWEVRYVPSICIIHHGGTSFAQVLNVKKQRYFDESLQKYFQKWHAPWQARLLTALHPCAMFEAWSIGIMRTRYGQWTAVVLGLEMLSLLTIFTSLPNTIAAGVIALIVFVLAWKRPTLALAALAVELIIGSKGYLLQFGGWPSSLSLRILMTVAFLCGWSINLLQSRGALMGLVRLFQGRRGYLMLFILIAYATLRGSVMGNTMEPQDANAWVDWFLLFPVLDISWRYHETLRREIVPVLCVGVAWLALKTLLVELAFAYGGSSIGSPLYLWIRRTGIGEVTPIVESAVRVFFQSHVYLVAAWILGVSAMLSPKRMITGETSPGAGSSGSMRFGLLTITVSALGLSMSRSLWFGAASGMLCLIILLIAQRAIDWKKVPLILLAKLLGAFVITLVINASLSSFFLSRASVTDAAGTSRWELLPIVWEKIQEHPILGSGFGATVTYRSADPRVLAEHPDGMYTTYAFEWGWLEHWVKFGIIGIPLLAYLLFSLGRRVWRLEEPLWLRAGAVSSLVALACLHVFTPYLNHPLGFLFFFVGEGMILSSHAKVRAVSGRDAT